MAHLILFKYLCNTKTRPAKMTTHLHSERQDSANHCVEELLLQLHLDFWVGAKVLILSNFVVEYKSMNESICTVVDVVYKDKGVN